MNPISPPSLNSLSRAAESSDSVSTNAHRPSRNPRNWHLQILVSSVLIVAVAMILQVRADQRVYVTGLSNLPIPESCGMQILFRQSCPGCGLTRSFIYLAHGDWQRSFAVHRVGWIIALLVAFQIPYRLIAIYYPVVKMGSHWAWISGIVIGLALIVNWIYNTLHCNGILD